MTDNKKHNEFIDNSLDKLLELGKPIPTMPEDLKNNIRRRLMKMETTTDKKKSYSFRWIMMPVAATAALILFVILPWLGNLSGSITWADVQKQFKHVRTISARACGQVEYQGEKKLNLCVNIFHKDPYFLRQEIEVSESDIPSVEPNSSFISILKLEPGRADSLVLSEGSRQAQLDTWLWKTDERREPPFQSVVNSVSKLWERIRKITEDETRIIGDRVIDGIPAIGFNFDGFPKNKINLPDNLTVIEQNVISGELWVTSDDGTPILLKVEVEDKINSHFWRKTSIEYTDIKWDEPLDENLFNLDVPEGWNLNKRQIEAFEYKDNKFAPGITLCTAIPGEKPLFTAEDVVKINQATQTTYPDSKNKLKEIKVTIELKPEAAQLLHDYVDDHPGKFIAVQLNRELNSSLSLDENHPDRIYFALAKPGYSLSRIEKMYFTETSDIGDAIE